MSQKLAYKRMLVKLSGEGAGTTVSRSVGQASCFAESTAFHEASDQSFTIGQGRKPGAGAEGPRCYEG